MKMMTLGPFEGNAWLFGRKVERSLAEWKGDARLAIIALPNGIKHEEYLAALEDAAGIPVVGVTTGGASFTERGFSRTGITCAFLGGTDVEVSCAAARELHADPAKGLRAAMNEMDEGGPRSGQPSSIR